MHGSIFISMSNGKKDVNKSKNSNFNVYAYNIFEKLNLFLETALDFYTFCNWKVVSNISSLRNRHYNHFKLFPKIISRLFCTNIFFSIINILLIIKIYRNTNKCKIYISLQYVIWIIIRKIIMACLMELFRFLWFQCDWTLIFHDERFDFRFICIIKLNVRYM